jgi:hypothetical protein
MSASAKFLQFHILFSMIFYVIQAYVYAKKAKLGLKQCFYCQNPSEIWLQHLEFKEFHISFHHLGQIFRELRSRAREEFRVCKIMYLMNNNNCYSNIHYVIFGDSKAGRLKSVGLFIKI